jgi:hypothetical protein
MSMSDEPNEEEELLVSIRWKFFKALLKIAGQQIEGRGTREGRHNGVSEWQRN